MKIARTILLVVAGAALCLPAEVSRAQVQLQPGSVVYGFDNAFSTGSPPGPPPSGTAPWVTTTFQNDASAGGVLLTISGADLAGSEKLDTLYFNLNPADNVNNLTFAFQSEASPNGNVPAQATISTGEDAFMADGDGKYDISFAFSTANQASFMNGDSITYLISGISGLTAADFDYLSTPAGGAGPFYAAAHIQAIGSGATGAWVDPAVPEPAAFGFVAAALAVVVTLRRRKSA